MIEEEWRPVVGAPGYFVSNHGRVIGRRGRILKFALDDGYHKVKLSLGSYKNQITRRVHILVLEAFVGPRPEGMMARHKDGVRNNNRIDNLAWGTQSENEADRKLHGTDNAGERAAQSKLTWDQVRQIRKEYQPKTRGKGNRSLAKKYPVHRSTIRSIVIGKSWKEAA